jgi:predicted transcriptional regulator
VLRESDQLTYLSKREQQIMDLAYERGTVTAAELTEVLPGKPTNSTVRTLLRILESKGQLLHVKVSGKFFYKPTTEKPTAARIALSHVTSTYFSGSVVNAIETLLEEGAQKLSETQLDDLERLIARARAACSLR